MISLSNETQSSLSQALIDLLNDSNLPAGTSRTFQVPCSLPTNSWYIVTLTRALSNNYSGIAHSIFDNGVYTINGTIGSLCNVSSSLNDVSETYIASDSICLFKIGKFVICKTISWIPNGTYDIPIGYGPKIMLNVPVCTNSTEKYSNEYANITSDKITIVASYPVILFACWVVE